MINTLSKAKWRQFCYFKETQKIKITTLQIKYNTLSSTGGCHDEIFTLHPCSHCKTKSAGSSYSFVFLDHLAHLSNAIFKFKGIMMVYVCHSHFKRDESLAVGLIYHRVCPKINELMITPA